MAYRRRQQVGRVETANIDPTPSPADTFSSSSSASSLATKAIRASSAYRDSSLSSVYEQSALYSPRGFTPSSAKDPSITELSPKKNSESKQGFWGALARKAKAVLDDDANIAQPHEEVPGKRTFPVSERTTRSQFHSTYASQGSHQKAEGPKLQKGLDAIASSLNYIGSALEGGIIAVENRTADIIQETRKFQLRKKNGSVGSTNGAPNHGNSRQPMMQMPVQPHKQADLETQLNASRDVAMAMAAKAKVLLRELKTVKADLAFAKERCHQLEDENRLLRESREKGDNPEDDDLIRLQLESLLAEKARLAQENSVYARENRFLKEIVEYHQLTMQDVVYLDEGTEEVTEVYPMKMTNMQSHDLKPASPPTPTVPQGAIAQVSQNITSSSASSIELKESSETVGAVNPYVRMPAEDVRRH